MSGFSPPEMAALCGISIRQLERDWQEAFQKTPTVWIRELRCRRVLEYLARGEKISSIAKKLHYASVSHLYHDFRKLYPESPRKTAFNLLIHELCRKNA